ncbi:MAG: pyridoxamine 5'-phosphate oxidase family protein, partial [Candidatus Nitrosocosmicus sp.]
ILNANPGVGAPLTEQQTKDFLTTSKLNIHIGTVDEKGHANIHPVWYYYDNSNNKFYILTGKDSKKVNNLKGNDVIYFCVDDPQFSNLINSANINGQRGDLVVEPICQHTVTESIAAAVACSNFHQSINIPEVGSHVNVTGSYVLDKEHNGWAEIHPVTSIIKVP